MRDVEQRRASRLVLFDDKNCVLLFRHSRKDGSSFWAPPGGGLEAGETFEQAALREAAEELGWTAAALKFLWEGTSDFPHVLGRVRQHERFYLLEGECPELSDATKKMHEQEGIVEARWWSIPEIESTEEPVFPEELASELRKVASRGG